MRGNTRAFIAAFAFACASCGGGGGSSGGGGGGGVVVPPAPTITVTARATADKTSVQEGQPFSVDASTSTATSGTLSYQWAQISGPAVTIQNPTAAKIDLNAGEVTADTVASFRVTVTANGISSQAGADVTFSNIAQTPTYGSGSAVSITALFTIPVRKLVGDFTFGLAGVANTATEDLSWLDFFVTQGADLAGSPSQLGTLPRNTIIKRSITLPAIPPIVSTDRFVTVIHEDSNSLRVMKRSTSGNLSEHWNVVLSRPCGFTHALVRGGPGFLVGQRSGLSYAYFGQAVPDLYPAVVGSGKPFCAAAAPVRTIAGGGFTGIPLPPTPQPNYFDIIALDEDANVFNLYVNNGVGILPNYTPHPTTPTIPVQLNATKPLKLMAWTETGLFGGQGFTTGMALVFSDGVHDGEHRLVIVGFDANHTLVQTTYDLGLGVPVDVLQDNIDRDAAQPEIVVVKSTSPQLEIYEPQLNVGVATGGVSPMQPRQFMEVGLGASSAARTTSLNQQGIFIAFPDKKQVKVIDVVP